MKFIIPVKNVTIKSDAYGASKYSSNYRVESNYLRQTLNDYITKIKSTMQSNTNNVSKKDIALQLNFNPLFNFDKANEAFGFESNVNDKLQALQCNISLLSINKDISKIPIDIIKDNDGSPVNIDIDTLTWMQALKYYHYVNDEDTDCRTILDLCKTTASNPDFIVITLQYITETEEGYEIKNVYDIPELRAKVIQWFKQNDIDNLNFDSNGVVEFDGNCVYLCPESFSLVFIPQRLGNYARSDEKSLEYFKDETCKNTFTKYFKHVTEVYRSLLLTEPKTGEMNVYTLMRNTTRVRAQQILQGNQIELVDSSENSTLKMGELFKTIFDYHTIFHYLTGYLPLFIMTDKPQTTHNHCIDVFTPMKEYYLKIIQSLYHDNKLNSGEGLIDDTSIIKSERYFLSESVNFNTRFMFKYINYTVVANLLTGGNAKQIDLEKFHEYILETIYKNITNYSVAS